MFSKAKKMVWAGLAIGALTLWMGSICVPGTTTKTPTNTPLPTSTPVTPTANATATSVVATATAFAAGTQTAAAQQTATAAPTATSSAITLFSGTVVGNAAVTGLATYPTSFFTQAANGEVTYNATGTTGIIPVPSSTKTINVSITGPTGYTGYPQIQFKTADSSIIITAPQNTANALTFSFVPNTSSTLSFSVIDTNEAAAGIQYTITITQ